VEHEEGEVTGGARWWTNRKTIGGCRWPVEKKSHRGDFSIGAMFFVRLKQTVFHFAVALLVKT
jgi:hypothetical protein